MWRTTKTRTRDTRPSNKCCLVALCCNLSLLANKNAGFGDRGRESVGPKTNTILNHTEFVPAKETFVFSLFAYCFRMMLFNVFFVVILVLYGYLSLQPHAIPSTPISFREYVSGPERRSADPSYASLATGSTVNGFRFQYDYHSVDTSVRHEGALGATSPAPAERKEGATESVEKQTVHPTELERELFQKETVDSPEVTAQTPTAQVQTPQQVPQQPSAGKTGPGYKGPFKLSYLSPKKKKYYFNPPPLGNMTRFQREVSRLTPGTKHIADTVEIFNRTLQWEDKSLAPGTVISTKPIASWFSSWKPRLRVNCNDNRNFALCQVHAVVSWDSDSRTFRTYQVQPCTEIGPFSDI